MKLPILDSISPRRRKLTLWGIGLFLFYTVTGFFILPPIIRVVAVKQLSAQLHREVSIQKVKLNPFALSTTIRGLLVKDHDGQPFVSWDEVYVNFQSASLFSHEWKFKEVSAINPHVRAQVNKDYTMNFSDIVAENSTNAPPAKPSKPFALNIELFHIGGATASVADLTLRRPFKHTVGPLDVTIEHFHTNPNNRNPYSFAGTTEAGEKFSWSGHFSLDPIRSQGTLALENISLKKYAPLYQDFVRFEIRDGLVDVRSTYRFELSDTNRVISVTNTSFGLHSLTLAEPDSDVTIAELADFTVSGASVDAVARQAQVSSISASDARLVLRRASDNSINVVELSKPSEATTNAPGSILYLLQSVTNVVAMLINSTNAWNGAIHEVKIQNCAVSLEDLVNSRPVRLDLDQITLNAKNISNVPATNTTASLSLRWNTNGSIKADVTASFFPLAVDIRLALDKLDLHPLDPYLESKLNLFILGSKLGMDSLIRLRRHKEQLPEVTFQGDVWLDDFSTVDGVLAEDLLKWQSVRIAGIDANLNPPSVSVKVISINEAYARVIIETNRTVNLMVALRKGDSNAASAEAAPAEPAVEIGAVAQQPVQETNTQATTLPKITISAVVISNAQMRFSDRSLKPNVNMSIQQLDGAISGLSTENLEHADVKLHAKVDNVGPVEITGNINPFTGNTTNELRISVKDVDLTPAGPYSGKYSGYRIAKGKLSLDLAYHLSGRQLKAENTITLDQFAFGEKVNSPDATKLPVRLAIAVLKDREGKIVLDVPIEGSLDDPQFHLGKVIARAVVNIITKIVTSPFSVLGAIFGGKGEEISFQNFNPGSAELLPPAKEKLDSLVKGLYERPGLQLEIEGSVDPDADREGLKVANLEKQMRTAKWISLRKSERSTTTADQMTLTKEERPDLLKKFYDEALSKGTIDLAKLGANTNTAAIAALLPPRKTEPEKGATALLRRDKSPAPRAPGSVAAPIQASAPTVTDPIELALLTTVAVTDGDLQSLATDRAKAVREYILQKGQVEPERLFLTESQTEGVKNEGSRVYLHFR